MYRIGIIEKDVESGTELEQWFLKYGEKMKLQFEICRWRFEDEIMADVDGERAPDILFLPIGEKAQPKDSSKTINRIWKQKVDGRTREAQLKCFHEKKKMEIPWTGIAMGMRLREKLDFCKLQLIYIAPKKALYDGIMETQPLEILAEPLTEASVLAALRRALAIVKEKNRRIVFQRGKELFFLPTEDIQYVCGDGRNVFVKTVKSEYRFNTKLRDVPLQLPEDFLVIHRSYIVNKKYVAKYNYEYVEMMDGTYFSISKAHRVVVRRILLDH